MLKQCLVLIFSLLTSCYRVHILILIEGFKEQVKKSLQCSDELVMSVNGPRTKEDIRTELVDGWMTNI